MIGKLVIQRWAVLGAVVAPDQAPESVPSDSREHSNRFLLRVQKTFSRVLGTFCGVTKQRSDAYLTRQF
jgi:hypothetical protein